MDETFNWLLIGDLNKALHIIRIVLSPMWAWPLLLRQSRRQGQRPYVGSSIIFVVQTGPKWTVETRKADTGMECSNTSGGVL
jgi:hypothetical protein